MNETLTKYLEFLEDFQKFSQIPKAQKAQMLSQINELIKADGFWVLNSKENELKARISKALCARLYSDIKAQILAKIKEQKFSIFSIFSKEPNQKYPKELKELRKRGDIDFAVVFGKGKDESAVVFVSTFIVFKKSPCLLTPIIQKIVRKHNCARKYIGGQNKLNLYDAFDESSELCDVATKCDVINFNENCAINLAQLAKIIPRPKGLKNFAFTHSKVLFYERLSAEILSANRQVTCSITCYTARSLWSDNYAISSYFKAQSLMDCGRY